VKDVMSGAFSTHGEMRSACLGNLKERDHLIDISVDVMIILNGSSRNMMQELDWIRLRRVRSINLL
jgi:hypothetical protein